MPDRRRIEIPWNLNDRQAALEVKKNFCAGIDAAGRSPSPCAEILRDDVSSAEAEFNQFLDVTDAEQSPKKAQHRSRTPADGCVDEAENEAPASNLIEDIDMNEDEGNDDDLYGLTPEAIVEDSMGIDEIHENAPKTSHPIAAGSFVSKRPVSLQNLTETKSIIDEASRRIMAMKDVVDISDDSSSSSGSDLGCQDRPAELGRVQAVQRPNLEKDQIASQAPEVASKSSSRSRTDEHRLEVKIAAEAPKRNTTSHRKVQLDLNQNVEPVTRNDANPVVEHPKEGNGNVDLLHTVSLPDTSVSPATPPVPPLFPSTSGVKYHTPFPRGTDGSIVPDTIRQPSLTASMPESTPLMKSKVFRGDLSGHIKSSLSTYALLTDMVNNPTTRYVFEYKLMI